MTTGCLKKSLSLNIVDINIYKSDIFNTTCITILLYGCESLVISQEITKCLCHVMLPNNAEYQAHGTCPKYHHLCNDNDDASRQLRFLGHILRLPDEEPARQYALYTPPHGRRKAGRPRTLYLTYIQRLLGDHEDMLQEKQIATLAKDRRAWRKLVVACAAAER